MRSGLMFPGVVFLAGCLSTIAFATDSTGMAVPIVPEPPSFEAVLSTPPPIVASTPQQLFQQREVALLDSIAQTEATLATVRTSAASQMPVLSAKDEFETSEAYAARKSAWEKALDAACAVSVKPLQQRVAGLEKSLKELRKQLGDYQGSLEITSSPTGAKVLMNGKEVGKTPLTLEHLWAGQMTLTLSYEGYLQFVATPQVQAGKNTELVAQLQEKSMFSQGNEVNLSALLAQDTTSINVYEGRIVRLKSRVAEVDMEMAAILANLDQQNPLEPKGEFETQKIFEKRASNWRTEGLARNSILQLKYQSYRTRLLRGIEVLQDYIVELEGKPKEIALFNTEISLGTYDADGAKYPFSLEHHQEGISFRWEGSMGMGIEDAKAMKKQTSSLDVKAYYYEIPVLVNGSTVYPAMQSLVVSRAGKLVPTTGVFQYPASLLQDPGVAATIARADSLGKGLVETRHLTAAYALNYEGKGASGTHGGPSKLAWIRGALVVGSVAGIVGGYFMNRDASRLAHEYNPLNLAQANSQLDDIRAKEKLRNIGYAAGGVMGLACVVTLAF